MMFDPVMLMFSVAGIATLLYLFIEFLEWSIYSSTRIGLHGKPFRLYKFRTMVQGADKIGPASTAGDDPRITKVGAFLRKYKLDELPQIINVLKRDMNIVGPRPDVPEVMELMHRDFPDEFDIITSVRPGITDLASLWDAHEEETLAGTDDPHRVYLEKIWPTKRKLQIEYIHTRNLWLDIKIILRTFVRIFLRG